MKIEKSIIMSIFFIIILLIIPNAVNAAEGDRFTNGDFEFVIIEENESNNLVDVSQYHGNATSITIPETAENEGKSFQVISIGTFYYSTIGYDKTLTTITIPKSVLKIQNEAFNGFDNLKEFIVSEDNEKYSSNQGVLFNKDKTELICYPKNKEGTIYEIPNTVENIVAKAFKDSILESIIIPTSMTEIGNSAFEGTKKLTNIIIPDSVITIKDNAFYECEALTNITIPKSVTTIESSAFLMATKLERINVAEENTNYSSVDGILFNKDKTEIVRYPLNKKGAIYQIPSSVKIIGSNAFNSCKLLTKIIIPKSVTTIKWAAFDSCEALRTISIPDSVTTIENYVFSWCNNLKSIIIPNSVTSMEDRTFFFGPYSIPVTIYCNAGSYAEEYAKNYTIDYKIASIYSVTSNLKNISSDGELSTSPELGDYTVTLTPNKGYKLPKSIIVKIAGINLGSNDYEYNYQTGELVILADIIDGDIEIEAVGEKMHKVIFDANDGAFFDGNNILTFEDAENCDFDNLVIPTRSGYKFIGYYTEKTGGISLETVMNSEEGIDSDITFYARWEKSYSYTFVTGESQTFTLNKINKYCFTIDGDYSLFSKLVINNLKLERDVDYIVTEGSTIIEFTEKGLAKLNALKVGTYDVIAEYSNDKEVIGKIIIEADSSIIDTSNGKIPQTGDNIMGYIGILIIAIAGIVTTNKLKKYCKNK